MAYLQYYPPVSFYFTVIFEGISGTADCRFSEVSGLKVDLQTTPYQEGGENRFERQLPTSARYANLVLKRGVISDSKVSDWFQKAIEQFIITPKNMLVMLMDKDRNPVASWSITDAYPIAWEINTFNSTGNDLAIETLTLKYSYFNTMF
jgi:phage tail-like protein